MGALTRSFGKPLSFGFIALVAIWLFGLILLPQISMIQRAFQVEDRGGVSAQLSIDIDKLYVRKFDIEQQLKALEQPTAAQPQAPSPFAPSMGQAPAAPSPNDPFAGLSAKKAPAGDPAEIEAKRKALQAEQNAVSAKIADLEAQETGPAALDLRYSLENFTSMSAVHFQIFVATLFYALCVTVLAFLVCYPVAYAVATAGAGNRAAMLLLALVVPYAINELLRIFAWVMILERQGLFNSILNALGVIDFSAGEGFRFVSSNGAVFAVMVYAYVLFMVFPIYNTIETLDRNQIEAARDLGASTWRIHTRIVIPHAKPGIAVGAIMTFMLSAGSIAVPEIVGRGMHPDWFSQVIYRRFFEADSWNQGAAYSLALLVACMVFILAVMAVFKVGIRDIAK
ncbi:ABC transporter permease [Zhengella mangrovi]|uniref:ABC transporter permease n=1 Tax=Zhengella mangrovi TaxID=1982044 RepID=A0A2G1QP13_9HYPH|nr:ABC transporter permease subunit [Zhengella mangrovi]PHP66958.1 ABC transporter permease [Zhengella mangrovi]